MGVEKNVDNFLDSLVMTDLRHSAFMQKRNKRETSHKVNLLIGAWNDIQIYQFSGSARKTFSRQCCAPAVSSTSFAHKSMELALRDYPIKTQMYALKCISQIVNRRNKLLHVQHYGNDLWFMMQFFLFPFMFWEQFLRRSRFEMIWNVIRGGGGVCVYCPKWSDFS